MPGADSNPCYPPWLQVRTNSISLQVRAKPGSSRRGVIRSDAAALTVGLSSPPEKGRANDELTAFLAEACGVPRSAIAIERGATGRDKLIVITTGKPSAAAARLLAVGALS